MLALSCCFGDSVRLLLTVFFALVFGSFFWSRARAKIRKILFCFYFVCLLSHSLSHSLSLSRRESCVSSALVFIYFLNGVRISRFQFQCRIKVASLDAVGRGVSGWQRERESNKFCGRGCPCCATHLSISCINRNTRSLSISPRCLSITIGTIYRTSLSHTKHANKQNSC